MVNLPHPPAMNIKTVVFFLCLSLCACAVENSPVQLPSQVLQVAEGQSVLIRLNEGEVTVLGGENGQVRVDGQILFPNRTEYNVTSADHQTQILADYAGGRSSGIPVRLEVHVPSHVELKIETEFASVLVRDYEGELEAASVSGDIMVEDVRGIIAARSNRGDVNVRESTGKISVVGNYGLLTVEDVQGDIGVSTIMGTIEFNGLIHAGDTVRLETDHGPVAVNLSPASAFSLRVRSNSGDVACVLPGVSSSIRTCDGELSSGGGALTIRTVSGPVTLQWIP